MYKVGKAYLGALLNLCSDGGRECNLYSTLLRHKALRAKVESLNRNSHTSAQLLKVGTNGVALNIGLVARQLKCLRHSGLNLNLLGYAIRKPIKTLNINLCIGLLEANVVDCQKLLRQTLDNEVATLSLDSIGKHHLVKNDIGILNHKVGIYRERRHAI